MTFLQLGSAHSFPDRRYKRLTTSDLGVSLLGLSFVDAGECFGMALSPVRQAALVEVERTQNARLHRFYNLSKAVVRASALKAHFVRGLRVGRTLALRLQRKPASVTLHGGAN
jgi:hypothetical protein